LKVADLQFVGKACQIRLGKLVEGSKAREERLMIRDSHGGDSIPIGQTRTPSRREPEGA